MGAAWDRVFASPRTDTRDTLLRCDVCRCCRGETTTPRASWKPQPGTEGSEVPDGHPAKTDCTC